MTPGEDEGIVRHYKSKWPERISYPDFIWFCCVCLVAGIVVWISFFHPRQ